MAGSSRKRKDRPVRVPFAEVRDFLEDRGWVIQKTWPPYVVFFNTLDRRDLPRLVEVHAKTVSRAAFEKIKRELEG